MATSVTLMDRRRNRTFNIALAVTSIALVFCRLRADLLPEWLLCAADADVVSPPAWVYFFSVVFSAAGSDLSFRDGQDLPPSPPGCVGGVPVFAGGSPRVTA